MFFKIENWNFQVHFEIQFCETSQNFNSNRQPIKKDEDNNCLKKLNVPTTKLDPKDGVYRHNFPKGFDQNLPTWLLLPCILVVKANVH